MRLFAKIKNKKYCCQSTTHCFKLQMHFFSGIIFWVHSSLGTTLTVGANVKVSGGKLCIRNYSGKKHNNCKGEKWSHNLKEIHSKLNFTVILVFLFEILHVWGCVQSTWSSSKLISYIEISFTFLRCFKILSCIYSSILCCLLCNHLKWWFSFYEAIGTLCAATDNISGHSLEKCSHRIKPEAQCPSGEMRLQPAPWWEAGERSHWTHWTDHCSLYTATEYLGM